MRSCVLKTGKRIVYQEDKLGTILALELDKVIDEVKFRVSNDLDGLVVLLVPILH